MSNDKANGMLVLSRKKNEDIIVDTKSGPVTVRVVEIHKSQVRLAIVAPKDVPVFRREVKERQAAQ